MRSEIVIEFNARLGATSTSVDRQSIKRKTKQMNGNYIIAGGSSGIGLELVQRLLPMADRIDVYSRRRGELPSHPNLFHHPHDFTDDDVTLEIVPDEVHGAAYCPGSITLRSFRSLKLDNFRADLEINLLGAVKFLKACLPGLKRGGAATPSSVVLISSVAASCGMPMHASIAAAKAAVEGLTRTLAAEWANHTRVNCLAPALTETPMTDRFFATEASRQAMAKRYPLGRTGTPSDVASMAQQLLSVESSWITGQVFAIDAGLSALRT